MPKAPSRTPRLVEPHPRLRSTLALTFCGFGVSLLSDHPLFFFLFVHASGRCDSEVGHTAALKSQRFGAASWLVI